TRADATILRFDHPAYQSLGASASDLQLALRALFDEVLSVDDTCDIRAYIQQQRALGNDRFGAMVEQKLGRCASLRPPHRPPAPPRSTDKALGSRFLVFSLHAGRRDAIALET